jgi:hypothetical protein
MIQAISLELLKLKLASGFEKAEKLKPESRVVEFGLYEVKGSKGNWYQVRAGRTDDNQFFVACTCPGSLHNGNCYHASIAFELHTREAQKLIDARKRQTEKHEQNNSPYLKNGSGKKPEKLSNGMRI